MKKKLLATAVAGVLASPAAMAEDGPSVTLYGRINNVLDYQDIDSTDPNVDATVDLFNVVSRLGVKAESDLGNGLKAIGRYEFFTFTDREGDRAGPDTPGNPKTRGGINDTRLGYVGISGGFGTVTAGNQWSAFYNTVGTHLDPTVTLGYYLYSAALAGPYRTSNTVKYANGWGPVNLEVDTRFSTDTEDGGQDVEVLGRDHGEDVLDGIGIGLSGTWNWLTLAAAYDVDFFDDPVATVDDETRIGVAAKGTWGDYWGSVSYMMNEFQGTDERDLIQVWVGGAWGMWSGFVGYGIASLEATTPEIEPSQITVNVTRSLGNGFRFYLEGAAVDNDLTPSTDITRILAGMRFDF